MARSYFRSLFKFLLVALFLTCAVGSHADVTAPDSQTGVYVKAGAGLVHYPEWGCEVGLWYQCGREYSLDMTAPTLTLGVGKRYTNWAIEASYLYLGKLHMWAIWESDDDYFSGSSDEVTGTGHSEGKFHGIEISGLYHFTNRLYGKLGYFGFEGTWDTRHVDLIDKVGKNAHWHVRRTRSTPVIGGGYALTDTLSAELTYFANLSMSHGAGVENAVTLTLVGRF